MSEKVFNEHQKMAIESRDKSIVVSAAAGSGKTSVLTERVLTLIEQGEDIERMLIVTFTNLAASEMKERIYKRLSQASIEKNQPRLAVQAEKSVFSNISTIHVFCNNLIRENFEYAGVSPTFSVASDAETNLLKQRALDSAVESYADKTDSFFLRYAQRANTSGIKNIVLKIYSRIISTKHPIEWLDKAEDNFSSDLFITELFEAFKQQVLEAGQKASDYLKQRSEAWELKGFRYEALASENERIEILRQLLELNMNSVVIPELAPIEKLSGAPYGAVNGLTKKANKCFEDYREYNGDFYAKIKKEQQLSGQDGRNFIGITKDFIKQYTKLKREKNVLDHDDSLHFAKKVLSFEAIAKRYQQKFAHVFVDEYQDINNVQHSIISSIKRSDNDFFVGDVKQCIYMFRESNPDLLIKRCKELSDSGLIEMNTNYRSSPAVIDFINAIMQNMMTEKIGGVNYSGGHKLRAGISGEGNIKVCIPISDSAVDTEALAIAANIEELINQGYSYGDIAVLRPEVSGDGAKIAKTLADFGIPVSSGFNSSDPDFSDISVYINLLKIIEGSCDDVSVLSVMRYPYFGFTEHEFAKIRIAADKKQKDQSFEDATICFNEKSNLGIKIKTFWEKIEYYRLLSDSLSLPDFLMQLRHEAGFDEYAISAPSGADKNHAILSFISSAGAMTHISGVLEIAPRIMNNQESKSTADPKSVFFSTIHKSKGLEFPVVILSGMQKRINQTDSSSSVLVGRSLGLAVDISDTDTHIKTQTLHKKIVAASMRAEKICETVRLLYVGMTRAKKTLIICGAAKTIRKQWSEKKQEFWQLDASSYLDLIMPALNMTDIDTDSIIDYSDYPECNASKQDKSQLLDQLFSRAESTQTPKQPKAYHPKIRIPSKLSVSAIKKQQASLMLAPVYAPSDDNISAAKRGTLMHKVLQKIGLNEKTPEEVAAFVEKLSEEGLFNKELSIHIDTVSISRFLNSSVAKRSLNSEKCLFEAPFCLQLPACEAGIANSTQPVIVQGVIDLCFIEDGSWIILDYKSDRVTKASAADAAKKYEIQLNLYAKALTAITGMDVKEKVIFFLELGQAVKVL